MINKEFEIKTIIDNIIKYIKEYNPSSDAPYHNNEHMITVYKFCKDISDNIELTDNLDLLVAALFHDFDHSMGKEKDNVNVQRAIEAFSDYYGNELTHTDVNKNNVINIIKITEYPYTIKNSELNTDQKIIRDADLLQGSVDNWYDFIVIGLSKEMNLPIDKIKEGVIVFRENIEYNFDYSREVFMSNNDEVTKKLNEK
jgi:HD superfamily phosphodiesterase